MTDARTMLVQKVLKLIDHYADSGDVSREDLAEQIVDGITMPYDGGQVRVPYRNSDDATEHSPPEQ